MLMGKSGISPFLYPVDPTNPNPSITYTRNCHILECTLYLPSLTSLTSLLLFSLSLPLASVSIDGDVVLVS
jgi:hypothetical protein